MKKEYRIRKNEEFSEIIGERKRFSAFSFLVYYRKRKEEHARIGISVSKKRGNAVVRNKMYIITWFSFCQPLIFKNSFTFSGCMEYSIYSRI